MLARFATRLLPALLLLAVVESTPANAAVLIHLTFEEMTDQSSAILLGRCIEVRSAWNATHTDIVTHKDRKSVV